jgi:hypothetical protein
MEKLTHLSFDILPQGHPAQASKVYIAQTFAIGIRHTCGYM